MVWEVAGRRGHVAEGPIVTKKWHALEDMNLVTGWLLWSHRMASRFGGMTGKEFSDAARAHGVALSVTEISRAERGEGDVPISAIGKYERMLGMATGSLSAPLRSAARLAHHAPGAERLAALRTTPRSAPARHEIVNHFYERYQDHERFTGSDWLTLVDAITYDEESLLPDALAAQWIRTLLDEGMRSVNAAYFPRMEALSTVAEHDRYATCLLAAIREFTAVPGVSGEADAWSLAGDIRCPEVIAQLVTELPSLPDDQLLFRGLALSMPAYRGDLTKQQQSFVAADLLRRLPTWRIGSYEPIATLAAALDEKIGEPILRRIDNDVHPMSRLTGHRDHREVQREVEVYTQAAMTGTWPDHPTGSVLPELLRLVVTSEQFGIRHHAANLIYCSPFSASICDAAIETSLRDPEPVARQLATYLVSRLATPDNDEQLRRLLKLGRRVGLVINTVAAMAHSGVLNDQDDLRPYLLNPDLRYIGIYAAGITHHPDLYRTQADGDWADWWRARRGGIWE